MPHAERERERESERETSRTLVRRAAWVLTACKKGLRRSLAREPLAALEVVEGAGTSARSSSVARRDGLATPRSAATTASALALAVGADSAARSTATVAVAS